MTEKFEVRLTMETINKRECHEGEVSNENNQRMVKPGNLPEQGEERIEVNAATCYESLIIHRM